MRRWEYKLLEVSDLFLSDHTEYLNQLGSQGWELVTVTDTVGYFFKREVEDVGAPLTEKTLLNEEAHQSKPN